MVGRVSIQLPKPQPSVIIAAESSSSRAKRAADFICTGTDDQVRIQSALDAIASIGGTVLLTAGQYTLSGAVEPPSGTAIRGEGHGTYLRTNAVNAEWGLDTGLIRVDGHGVTVSDLRVDGRWDGSAATGATRSNGIALTGNSERCFVERVWCTNTTRHGLWCCGERHSLRSIHIRNTGRHCLSFGTGILGADSAYHSAVDLDVGVTPITESGVEINDGAHDIAISHLRATQVRQAVVVADHNQAGQSCYNLSLSQIFGEDLVIALVAIFGNTNIAGDHRNIAISGLTASTGVRTALLAAGRCRNVVLFNAAMTHTAEAIVLQDFNGNRPNDISIIDSIFEAAAGSPGNQTNPMQCNRLRIANCRFTKAGRHSIVLTNTNDCVIENNEIIDSSQNAGRGSILIQAGGPRITIRNNLIGDIVTSSGLYGISIESGASVTGCLIEGNRVVGVPLFNSSATLPGAQYTIRNNIGYTTKASGTSTITSGNTTVVVAHGLDRTPTAKDISVTATNDLGDATKYWISAVGATTFTINVDADPGATTATFAWTAEVLP